MSTKSANSYIKLFVGILFVILITGYTYFQSGNFIEGPTLVIDTPANGSTFSKSLITIEGTARHITHIQLNNDQIFVDEYGKFSEQLLLSLGYNIITLEAQDRFGRETTKTLELVYK